MVTSTQSFKIFQLLFKHTNSQEDAQALVQEIENVIDYRFEREKELLASKQDIALLREDVAKAEGKLYAAIAESKSDMLKWVVALWVVQMLAIVGLYFKK